MSDLATELRSLAEACGADAPVTATIMREAADALAAAQPVLEAARAQRVAHSEWWSCNPGGARALAHGRFLNACLDTLDAVRALDAAAGRTSQEGPPADGYMCLGCGIYVGAGDDYCSECTEPAPHPDMARLEAALADMKEDLRSAVHERDEWQAIAGHAPAELAIAEHRLALVASQEGAAPPRFGVPEMTPERRAVVASALAEAREGAAPALQSIDELLTPDQRAALSADLTEMAKQRRKAAGSAGDVVLGGAAPAPGRCPECGAVRDALVGRFVPDHTGTLVPCPECGGTRCTARVEHHYTSCVAPCPSCTGGVPSPPP